MSAFWSQFCIDKSRWERESCPLSGIEKRPPLGGYVSIKVVLDTIRNTTVVRCREAVLFSEGPLSEARLYYDCSKYQPLSCTDCQTPLQVNNIIIEHPLDVSAIIIIITVTLFAIMLYSSQVKPTVFSIIICCI